MSDIAEPLPLPPGREALVAVDLCDLARLWNRDAALAAEVLDMYEPLSETLREDHGGRALPIAGDRELLGFPSVDAALLWALRMQEALLVSDWPADLEAATPAPEAFGQEMVSGGLRTAMSIQVGHPTLDADTVLAMVDIAHPGQVIISEDTWALCTMPGRARDLAVKDLEAVVLYPGQPPTRLVSVLPRLLGRRRFPALRQLGRCHLRPAHNAFIGRRPDLQGLAERLQAGGRLVCIIGPSGLGKTRLALHHARQSRGDWPGGVWVCPVQHTQTRADLLTTLAETLGATKGRADIAPLDHIAQAIRGLGEALIVLDGFDIHVPTAGETLGLWVRAAPKIRFLVTATEALDLEWETRMSLEPMPEEEILSLLHARIRAGLRGIGRTPPRADAIAPLAAHCQGRPLAAELVAAEVLGRGLAATQELLEQEETAEDPIRAVAAASWASCTETAKQAITATVLYPGLLPIDGVAAGVIGAAGEQAPLATTLADLQIRGLMQPTPIGPPSRLRVPQAIAEHAPQRSPPLETHLASWVLRAAEEGGPSWAWQELVALAHLFERWREDDPALAVQIALAMEPVLVETGWASLHQELLDAAVSLSETLPQVGPRIRAARASAHRASGRWADARADLDALLATDLGQADRARALQGLGELHWAQDAPEAAVEAWEEARELLDLQQAPDPGLLTMLASGLHAQGEDIEAAQAADEAIAAAESAGLTEAAGRARTVRGRLHLDAGAVDLAARVLEPALAAAMDAHDARQAAVIRGQLAEVALLRGRPETALAMYEQSTLALAQAGHRTLLAQMYATIGAVQLVMEQLEEAEQALDQALRISREIGRGDIEAQVLARLGIVARAAGDIDGALDAFAGALGLAQDQADPTLAGFVLAHRAAVEAAWDRLDVADEMLADAHVRLVESGDTMYQVILDVLAGFADLARARDAAASEDEEQEAAHIDHALNRLARGTSHESRVTPPRGGETPHRLGDLRVALRLLDGALSALTPRELPPE